MDYKSMKLDDLAEYINLQLEKGRNFTEVANNDFSCNESTLRKRLTGKKLYKRIGNKYVRQCQTEDDKSKNSKQIKNVRQSVRQHVTDENMKPIISDADSRAILLSTSDKQKFLSLISSYESLMSMLNDYESSKDKFNSSNGLVVELPAEKKKDFRVTLRVNDVVYEEFKAFADKNKQFTVKELVSQALKEFIKKYE